MLKLTTGEGITVKESAASFQTCLPSGQFAVIVDWRMYSEEFKEWCGSKYQDALHAWIEFGDEVLDVADLKINDLCPPGECNGCGSAYEGLEKAEIALDKGDVWKTPWISSSAVLEIAADGQLLDLHVALTDAGDTTYDTVVLVDRIRFVACDEACAGAVCGDNVCGQSCGECDEGIECNEGVCG